jgi:predicted transcriptional regulator YheO
MMDALASYVPICDAVAALLAPHAEVVLHDLGSDRIFHIANAYSKRRAGDSSLTEPVDELRTLHDVIGPYQKVNWDGRRLKSVTAMIRNGEGEPIGLLCINHDVEAFAAVLDHLVSVVAPPLPAEADESDKALLFRNDWREAVNALVGAFLAERHVSLAGLTRADTDALIETLHRSGIFEIRKAVLYVAQVLGLSRSTIYNRLKAMRKG